MVNGSLLASKVHAEEGAAEQSALVMMRLLAYDRNIADRTPGQQVNFTVVYPAESTPGGIYDALVDISTQFQLDGRRVNVESVDHRQFEESKDELESSAILVTEGLEDHNEQIASWGIDNSVLTFGQSDQLVESGSAIGVLPNGDVKLVVNLRLAQAQGADFPGSVLRTADAVHR